MKCINRLIFPLLVLGACVGGCATQAARMGPAREAVVWVSGSVDGRPGNRVTTAHYLIDTTITNHDFVRSLGQLMEAALEQYHQFAPKIPLTPRPMQCHIFATREQWASYTRHSAGADAAVYLQINRGGYTAGDVYVAYYIGAPATTSVAAHEGWHQFVARHFQRRPPPFLEEGLACLFENVAWDGPLPRWDLSSNPLRLNGIRRTLARGDLIPLDQLCAMHAGQVVNSPGTRIEAFYSQSWAFARFLWDGEDGRYRPLLQRMLNDLAAGEPRAVALSGMRQGGWEPRSAKPLLEHYLKQDLSVLDREYRSYLASLAAS